MVDSKYAAIIDMYELAAASQIDRNKFVYAPLKHAALDPQFSTIVDAFKLKDTIGKKAEPIIFLKKKNNNNSVLVGFSRRFWTSRFYCFAFG